MAENTTYQLRSSNGNTADVLNNLAENGIPAFTTFEVFPRFTKVEAGTPSTSKVNFDAMFSGTNQWNKEKTYAKDVYVTIYNANQPLESKIYKTLTTVPSSVEINNTTYWQDETSTFFTISGNNAYHNYIQEIPKCYTHAICIKSTFDPAHQNVIIDWGDSLSVALSDAIELKQAIHDDKLTADNDQHLSAVLGKHADGSYDVIYEKPDIKPGTEFGKNRCYTYYCYHDYMPAMVKDGIVKLTVNGETVTATQSLPDQPYTVLIYGTTFYGLGRDSGVTLQYYIDPAKDYDITTGKFKSNGDRSTKSKFSHVLLSRIFDPDLPFFPHTNITLASLANRAKNLLYINIPKYFDAFNNVINTYEMFERCSNLQYCNGFSNKLRFKSIRGMCRMFNCCENLLKCDITLAKYVVDHNVNSVHDGNKEVFSFCSKLAVDVMSLLPIDGFSARYMNLTGAFSRCNSLDIANKYVDRFERILWKDITKVWKTHADYNEDNKNIAGNLDMGTIQIKDSPAFYGCNQLIQNQKTTSNNSIIPNGWKNLLPYTDPDIIQITIPTLTNIAYDGSEHSVTVLTHAGYTIDEINSTLFATDVGNYKVTLKLNEGYIWSNGSSENQEIEWSITKADNKWTTEPYISKSSWYENDIEPGVLTTGDAKFGEVVMMLGNEEIDELPTTVGTYTIEFVVEGNDNYTGLNKTITFSILEVEEPLTFDDIKLDIEHGEVKTGLGENGDEVAVIFKNADLDNIQWTVPGTILSAEFLAVAGGGGGGGGAQYGATSEINRGGAGGGGGGVVTGYINVLPKDSILNVVIGKGGIGGAPEALTSNGAGKAPNNGGIGGNTILSVNNIQYLIARGGGRDLGLNKWGGKGGSNAGSRITSRQEETAISSDIDINKQYILSGNIYGHLGGKAYTSGTNTRSAAGGGGAMSEGGNSVKAANKTETGGGAGGAGLSSYITGELKVYGSGGGGGDGNTGKGGNGGIGAGDGGYGYDESNGGDALPNQGGGGGGCGRGGNYKKPPAGKGGNGGSGIFVLRFKINKQEEPDTPDMPDEPDNEPINPLTFTSTGNTTIKLKKVGEPDPISLTYQIDDNEPQNYEIGTTINLSDGQALKMYATTENTTISKDNNNYYGFDTDRATLESYITVSGNINTLLKTDGSINDLTGKNHCFVKLFYQCAAIFYAHDLKLPADKLSEYCYYTMFSNCTNLITAPELPAKELSNGCYAAMFQFCFALTQAPELPATELTPECYTYMFYSCENLSTITVYFEDWHLSQKTCLLYWLVDTAENGIFKCKNALKDKYNELGESGILPKNMAIPATWTIETID